MRRRVRREAASEESRTAGERGACIGTSVLRVVEEIAGHHQERHRGPGLFVVRAAHEVRARRHPGVRVVDERAVRGASSWRRRRPARRTRPSDRRGAGARASRRSRRCRRSSRADGAEERAGERDVRLGARLAVPAPVEADAERRPAGVVLVARVVGDVHVDRLCKATRGCRRTRRGPGRCCVAVRRGHGVAQSCRRRCRRRCPRRRRGRASRRSGSTRARSTRR